MRLSLIVAVSDNGTIGRGNDLPWRLPDDFRRFKAVTMGHHLLMGRKTWESIGRPLPGRTTVVISRRRLELPAGVKLAASVDESVEMAAAAGDDEAFVAGGAEIYRQLLARADRLYLTRVHADVAGDVAFPEFDPSEWRLVVCEKRPVDERHSLPFSFLVYERRVVG